MPDQNTPRLAGRVIEAGRTSSNGCTFSAVTIEVAPDVAQRLAGHLYGEVLIDPVGLPGDRLTSAPSPVDRRPREPAHLAGVGSTSETGKTGAGSAPEASAAGAERRLSPGEQLVWAACYAQFIVGGSKPADAARHATTYALSMRLVAEAEVRERSGLHGGADATLAAVEQMRGGR